MLPPRRLPRLGLKEMLNLKHHLFISYFGIMFCWI